MSRRRGDLTDAELAEWGVTPQALRVETKTGVLAAKSQGALPSTPTRQMTVLQSSFDTAKARVLSLGSLLDSYSPGASEGTRFPPMDTQNGASRAFMAGMSSPAALFAGQGSVTSLAACVLQYGAGGSTHRVWFDWRPGNYNLPPCEAVQIDVVPWGVQWASEADFLFSASVSPGQLLGAHVPTVTAAIPSTAAGSASVGVPSHARAVDVYCTDETPAGTIKLVDANAFLSASVLRDYTNQVFMPPWSPVACEGGQALSVVWSATMAWAIKFYLAL